MYVCSMVSPKGVAYSAPRVSRFGGGGSLPIHSLTAINEPYINILTQKYLIIYGFIDCKWIFLLDYDTYLPPSRQLSWKALNCWSN